MKDQAEKVEEVRKLNMEVQQQLIKEREEKEKKVIENIKSDVKAFFKYANKQKISRARIGPLKYNNTYTSGPEKMADILSEQYKSVFTEPSGSQEHLHEVFGGESLTDIEFLQQDFIEAMKSIKTSSAKGPDGIPAHFFNLFAEELAEPVMKIWRISLESGVMPDGTILSVIVPIFKGSDKTEAKNYRPVALTNHLTKIFERVIRKAIVKHLEAHGLANKTQHGFTSKHSTITLLLAYYDSILNILEEGKTANTIYLDFAKAFDKVDQDILLRKVYNLGIQGKLYKWIEVFLKNRQQTVRVEGVYSKKEWVKSGVPQGSVLGPLLFIIMMIDTDKDIKDAFLLSYADDTKLWRAIQSLADQERLQQQLNIFYDWAQSNDKYFNDENFEALYHGEEVDETVYTSPSGAVIEVKQAVKDLGLYMEGNAKFKKHIEYVMSSGKRLSGWALRVFHTKDTNSLITLYKALVLTKMEYACIIWSPTDAHSINHLENVQRRFTSRLPCFQTYNTYLDLPVCTVDYWTRLQKLKIFSLQRRRERYMIIHIYKIIIGLCPNPGFDITYSDRNKIIVKPKRTVPCKSQWAKSMRESSFFCEGPRLYNLLEEPLREHQYIDNPNNGHVVEFKGELDKFLRRIPDQPTVPGADGRQADSNSLVDQITYITREGN